MISQVLLHRFCSFMILLAPYPFTCLEPKFGLQILVIFLPKNVNFQGSGSAIFSAVWQITISGKFSSIFIPEIAKTDFERFEKPLTAANFLALSGRNY